MRKTSCLWTLVSLKKQLIFYKTDSTTLLRLFGAAEPVVAIKHLGPESCAGELAPEPMEDSFKVFDAFEETVFNHLDEKTHQMFSFTY